jgi:predicted ATPase/class 3 adenylate cyclase
MAELPSGTVTFLLSDVEGSTALWEQADAAMRDALARHDVLFDDAVSRHAGVHIRPRGEGDSRFAVFVRAHDAVEAALDIQRAFAAEAWPTPRPIRVRIGVHSGEAQLRAGDYYGTAVNRCARLRGIGHGGQVLLSGATTALARDQIPPGVGLVDLGQHRLKDLSQPEQVFQPVVTGLPSVFPPLTSIDSHPHNLPVQATPLLGREREVEAVSALLSRDDVRLVTLTGPGGTGKTRLSLQAAAEILDSFEDGVFFVSLAPVTNPDLVPAAIAQVLGLRDEGARPPLEVLKEYLRGRSLLLLLDNFEQILPAGSCIAELLAAGPRVGVLATSRAALRVRGEHEFAVPPLALPDLTLRHGPDDLLQYAAVALFVERVASIRPTFALTAEHAEAVGEICFRLDGLPLAIELAAARIRLFSPRALLARLERRLPLLTGGAQDLPARQQTLRRAIAWSYDLLDPAEQRLFRRLAVCVGGFMLEAAEQMCAAVVGTEIDVLDGVASLAAKSLIRQDEGDGGEPRFAMLETIREYGLECLEESGEATDARRRHAECYLALAEEASANLRGPEQLFWLTRLEAERDNFRSVLSGSPSEDVDPTIGLRMAGALLWYWNVRGNLDEGRHLLEAVLARTAGAPSALRAKVLFIAAMLAKAQSDPARATTLLEESLGLARAYGDTEGIAHACGGLSDLALDQGDFDRARSLANEAIVLAQSLGDQPMIALGHAGLGRIAHVEGDRAGAESAYAASLAVRRALGDKHGIAWSLHYLALVTAERDDYGRALALDLESLRLRHEVDDRRGIAGCLEGLAYLAVGTDQAARAARLLAAAGVLRGALNAPCALDEEVRNEGIVAAARAVLEPSEFAATWTEGQVMSLEQVVSYALEGPGSP